ncbi:hypothetical protein, partial [Novosphingobium sp.]|uniref:hypothetical protein n=1 Tax=Novosphingobium sp. TaxID=1874826 RepID=UPI002604A7F5
MVIGVGATVGNGSDPFAHGGDDTIDGGDDTDTAAYAERRDRYTVVRNAENVLTVIANFTSEGTDTLTGVEQIAFTDATISAGDA